MNLQNSLIILVKKISKYSTVYYLIIAISLGLLQMDIFKENIPVDYVINGVIVLAMLTFTTNIIDKILKKTDKDGKAFIYCPVCPNAKMRTDGDWVCENCNKSFGEPKKE